MEQDEILSLLGPIVASFVLYVGWIRNWGFFLFWLVISTLLIFGPTTIYFNCPPITEGHAEQNLCGGFSLMLIGIQVVIAATFVGLIRLFRVKNWSWYIIHIPALLLIGWGVLLYNFL